MPGRYRELIIFEGVPPIGRTSYCPVFAALALFGCAKREAGTTATLHGAFRKDIPIGVAIHQRQFSGKAVNDVAIILSQFNPVSPENALKWESVHPRPGHTTNVIAIIMVRVGCGKSARGWSPGSCP